jgi:hypothetical protein
MQVFDFSESNIEDIHPLPLSVFLEAQIMESTRVMPYNIEDKNTHVAIGYLIFDRDKKEYYSWAETMILSSGKAGTSKILNILTAIVGKVVTYGTIKRSGFKINMDKIIGRHVSLYFSNNTNNRPKVQQYVRIAKNKWTDLDASKYSRPDWIDKKLYNPTIQVAEGTLDESIDGADVEVDIPPMTEEKSPVTIPEIALDVAVEEKVTETITELDIDIQ